LQTFTSKHIDRYFDYSEFIDFLQQFYRDEITTPDRIHYQVNERVNGAMLVMPSWGSAQFMGVKLVNVFPDNKELASINGIYVLMSRETGEMLAHFDGLALTCKRTAAVSALAAKLIRSDRMPSMLMIGTGNMSDELIRAHHSVQKFDSIGMWGRDIEKARLKVDMLKAEGYPVELVKDKDAYANDASLISVATLATSPILFGKDLRSDVYVDLVGSYKKDTREADDSVIMGADLYVDTYMALTESGELKIPLEQGVIKRSDVHADIIEMSRTEFNARNNNSKKVVFKSVGFAASDLACAAYLMSKATE